MNILEGIPSWLHASVVRPATSHMYKIEF